MTREEKAKYIDELVTDLSGASIFYLADTADLTVEVVNSLRRRCFQSNIRMRVVKNTLLEKAMDASESNFGDLTTVLKGNTSILIADTANAPAKIIKEFRKKSDKPVLKGAFINSEIYIGDNLLDSLASLKSKEEVIGEIIGLLQSPAQRVISALKNQFKDEAGAE